MINDEEARQLAGEHNLRRAAARILKMGPTSVIIKRGDAGALLFHGGGAFAAPAMPLADVVDPTGAGDSFAGGLMGYLAYAGDLSPSTIRTAMISGSVMGSRGREILRRRRARLVDRAHPAALDELSELVHFEKVRFNASSCTRYIRQRRGSIVATMKRVFAVGRIRSRAPPRCTGAGRARGDAAATAGVGYARRFLVDAAADLHLRDDQVARCATSTPALRRISNRSTHRRAANRPTDADAAPAQPMAGGGRHGGMGGGAMPSGGNSMATTSAAAGSGSAVSPSGGAAASRLADPRAGEVREALKRAFAVLDAGQQQQAKQVLAAHDVDVDADAAPAPPPTSGSDDDPAPEP
jgi:hypothetical protein